MPKIFLTPGPSQLYFTAQEHLKNALREGVPSISHRSREFEKINQHTQEMLRELMGIPEEFRLFYTGSATEAWERIGQNLLMRESCHLINGAFSRRFADIVDELGLHAVRAEAKDGDVVSPENLNVPDSAELIAITHNETSTGASQPWDDISGIRQAYPEQLIALDVVSSAPDVNINFSDIDTTYFSVQKAFGLPAGLGVWLVNERCIEVANRVAQSGKSTGSYHSLTSLLSKADKFQTPETPNVLGIYLLGKIAEDMAVKGIDMIRRETAYKAAVLYQAFADSEYLTPFVENPSLRSRTTTVAACSIPSSTIRAYLETKGFVAGSGYGKYKDQHIRIASFPTHSKEQVELVSDLLGQFQG